MNPPMQGLGYGAPQMGAPAPPGMMPTGMGAPAPPGMMPPGMGAPAPPGMMPPGMGQPQGNPMNQPMQGLGYGATQMGAPAPPGPMPPGMGAPAPPGMMPPGMGQPQGNPMNQPMQGLGYGAPQMGVPAPPGMMHPGMGLPQGNPMNPLGYGAPQMGVPAPPGMMPHGMRPGLPGDCNENQQRPRLDPNVMPSVIQVIEDDRSSRTGPFPTGYPHAEPPPLVTTSFSAQDQGNCNPKFMRASLYNVPQNSDMIKASQIPLTVAISPFAKLLPNENRPPIVDLGELGPVRCQRCKAYICAFMEFQDGGRRFRCPFCQSSTPVTDMYFSHVDHTGRRTDIQHRPELYLGSYEFVATTLYCKNGVAPKQPAFIFMIDVSYNSIRSGVVSTLCHNLVSILNDLPVDSHHERSEVQIGLVTYDQCIHFYNLMNPSGQPEMLVVNDIEDVFVPFIDGFLVPLDKALPALTACLEKIENMFADTRITEVMLGPVIQAGLDALKCSDRAGKLLIFHSSLPTFEAPGKLKNREDRKVLATDREKTVLSPATDFYTKLGQECVKYGCAVDLFLFPSSFIDLATISPLSSLTGGTIYKYQYFDIHKDAHRFLCDLRHDVSREIAFDVMMRVRTSTGIRPTGFYGSLYMQNTTDMEIGCIDSDKAVHVEIKHDDKLKDGDNAYVQVAVLFTSCSGQRRLRIHNLCLPVSADYNQLYRVADQDSLISYLLKTSLKSLRDKAPKEMRTDLSQRCAQMLATYREKCSDTAPLGQLILPECLKLLPLYINCILRHEAVSGGPELTVDDRAWQMQIMEGCKIEEALAYLYPRIYDLTELSLPAETPLSEFTLPMCVRASHENFQAEKTYLIENGLFMFIWIGSTISAEWITDVFGAPTFSAVDSENSVVPERDNSRSRAVRHLIELVHEGRQRRMKVHIIKQQDSLEAWMKKFLVEDKSLNTPNSYVDFLCYIHREIRTMLT